nr:ribosomal protein S3 [Ostreobium quekettii]
MGQKIHPIGFRLGITKNHQSKWFIDSIFYSNLVVEDYFIRKNVFNYFSNVGISNIEIQRKFNDHIQVTLHVSKPGALLAQNDTNLEKLSNNLTIQIKNYRKKHFSDVLKKASNLTTLYSLNPKITVQIFELIRPDMNAYCLANFLVEQLEKRIAFRRAIKKTLRKAQKAKVTGIKIQISGRLNGAEIARSEWVREGRIPLQTLRADIYYCYRTAKTIFGILGIKIWVFKN